MPLAHNNCSPAVSINFIASPIQASIGASDLAGESVESECQLR